LLLFSGTTSEKDDDEYIRMRARSFVKLTFGEKQAIFCHVSNLSTKIENTQLIK
jgi:hypothetical protein